VNQLPGANEEVNFALQLVKHIRTAHEDDVIKSIEVGNEEWSYVKGTCQNMPSVYIPVLEQTYTAIKQGGQGIAGLPGMLVGTYGYTNYATATRDVSVYWKAFFSDTSNPGNFMDYANFHFYHGATDPNQQETTPLRQDPYNQIWQAIQAAAAQYGHARMPIWTTETGWQINLNGDQPVCVSGQSQQTFEQEVLDDARTSSSTVNHLFLYSLDIGNAGMSLTQAQKPPTLCYPPSLNSCTGPNATLYYTAAYCMLRTYTSTYSTWH
jgi:hypothetical protein